MEEAEADIAYVDEVKDGLKIYTGLAGYGCSSTRAELAAGILALVAPKAVHIGTDSEAFLDKALYVLELCRKEANPKRAWTQRDGDLWMIFHIFALAKGLGSIRISKVTGHATETMIAEGKVRAKDKRGNDEADEAAERGIQNHGKVCYAWPAGLPAGT